MWLEGPLISQAAASHGCFFFFLMGQEKRKRLLQLVHCLQTQEKCNVESKRDE